MRLALPSLNSYARLNESHDDGPLPDLVSGLMWLITGITAVLVLWLPGTVQPHFGWLVGLAGTAIGWGCVSLVLGLRRRTMPLATRAAVTASVMPVFALGLWATGRADSYLQPVLLFTALFIAYFPAAAGVAPGRAVHRSVRDPLAVRPGGDLGRLPRARRDVRGHRDR
jgi:hypothetical protein